MNLLKSVVVAFVVAQGLVFNVLLQAMHNDLAQSTMVTLQLMQERLETLDKKDSNPVAISKGSSVHDENARRVRRDIYGELLGVVKGTIGQSERFLKGGGYECGLSDEQDIVMQQLRRAIHEADCAGIAVIVEKDPEVLSRTVDGETPPIIEAVLSGHVNVVGALLDAKADIEAKRVGDQVTPLLAACSKGSLPMVRFLLEHDASVRARDYKGRECLHKASRMRDSTMVTLLLEKRADVNCANGYGETPLMVAAGMGDEILVRNLVVWKAEVNAVSHEDKMTALHAATTGGNSDLVQFLLESKADILHKTKGNGTVLMRAAIADDAVMALRLIEAKADPCAMDDSGKSAAAYAYSKDVRELLKEASEAWRAEHADESLASVEEKESDE